MNKVIRSVVMFKLEFYRRLLAYLTSEIETVESAEILSELCSDGQHLFPLSVGNINSTDIRKWRAEYRDQSNDEGLETIFWLTECLFLDMTAGLSHLHDERVRDLIQEYKKRAGIPDDLFILNHRVKDMGDRVAVITLVVDDVLNFRKFMENPDHYVSMIGKIHYTDHER